MESPETTEFSSTGEDCSKSVEEGGGKIPRTEDNKEKGKEPSEVIPNLNEDTTLYLVRSTNRGLLNGGLKGKVEAG